MGCGLQKNSVRGKKIVMLGLDGAGKTTLLYLLSRGQIMPAVSTIGYNQETFAFGEVTFSLFEFGGKNLSFAAVRDHFQKAAAIIYAVDASARDRLDESYRLFRQVLQEDQLQNVPVLILLCKSDAQNCITPEELKGAFQLLTLSSIVWHVHQCSSVAQRGVKEAFEWIAQQLRNPRRTPEA